MTDEETWARRLERALGCSLYNLAMSGSNPVSAVASLEAHIEALRPRHVLLMIYEGNDFKGSKRTPRTTGSSVGMLDGIEQFVETSAIYLGLKRAAISWFGGVGENRPLSDWRGLEWMPLEVAGPKASTFYSFKPKRLHRLMQSPTAFRKSNGWTRASEVLVRLKRICEASGIDLTLLYAASKPHVVLPLCERRISSASLHRFLSFHSKHLPGPNQVKSIALEQLDTSEQTTKSFCDAPPHSLCFEYCTPACCCRSREAGLLHLRPTLDARWPRCRRRPFGKDPRPDPAQVVR